MPSNDTLLTFTGVPSHMVDQFWPIIEPVLLRAILRSDGRHSWLSTKNACRDQNWQLWAAFEDESMSRCIAALTTQTATYPTGVQECEITLAAGDIIPQCLPLLDIIEKWAKSVGCSAVSLTGRRGWSKLMSRYNFEDSATVLRKRI